MEIDDLTIAKFDNYRAYLRSVFDHKKRINRRFSFRRFAEVAGMKSPNYLQLIIEGRRNLSLETAAKIASRLKIAGGEKDYFLALVKMDNAGNPSEKDEAERARVTALKKILSREFPVAQREIFGRWFYLLVRELFLLKNSSGEASWIRKKLGNLISENEASMAVKMLSRTGMLKQTETGFTPVDPVLVTNDQQMQASLLREFHADVLRTWAANLDKLGPAEQELGLLNIPINSEKIPELRRRVQAFQDEIIGWVQDEKEADRVVQLGTYLIPFP